MTIFQYIKGFVRNVKRNYWSLPRVRETSNPPGSSKEVDKTNPPWVRVDLIRDSVLPFLKFKFFRGDREKPVESCSPGPLSPNPIKKEPNV
jgi:hypothetical protein